MVPLHRSLFADKASYLSSSQVETHVFSKLEIHNSQYHLDLVADPQDASSHQCQAAYSKVDIVPISCYTNFNRL